MTDYTVLKHLLHDITVAESPAEVRSNMKAADDHILELAEQIKAKRALKAPVLTEHKAPLLVRFGDDVRITLWKGEQAKIFSRPINSLRIYKTNEPAEITSEKITANPGKDGYTWFMKVYGPDEYGHPSVSSKILEPHEGPILHKLLAEAWRQ